MSHLKSLVKDTAISGLSSIVGRFLNYLLTPLYTIKLASASGEYGIMTNMYAITALILSLIHISFAPIEHEGKVITQLVRTPIYI